MPKFCKDCKHYNISFGHCSKAYDETHLVTGSKFQCNKDAKEMRYSEAYCGAEGKWFEKAVRAFE